MWALKRGDCLIGRAGRAGTGGLPAAPEWSRSACLPGDTACGVQSLSPLGGHLLHLLKALNIANPHRAPTIDLWAPKYMFRLQNICKGSIIHAWALQCICVGTMMYVLALMQRKKARPSRSSGMVTVGVPAGRYCVPHTVSVPKHGIFRTQYRRMHLYYTAIQGSHLLMLCAAVL